MDGMPITFVPSTKRPRFMDGMHTTEAFSRNSPGRIIRLSRLKSGRGKSDNLQFIGGKKQPFGSPDGVTASSGLFMIYSEYA